MPGKEPSILRARKLDVLQQITLTEMIRTTRINYLRSSISQPNKLHYSLDIPFTVNINSHLEIDHHHKDDGQLVIAQTLSQGIKGPTSGCISAVLGHARPNLGSSAPHIKPQYHSYRPEFLLRRRQALLKKNDGLKKNP